MEAVDRDEMLKLKKREAFSRPEWICSALGLITREHPIQPRGVWADCPVCGAHARLSVRTYPKRVEAPVMAVCWKCDWKSDVLGMIRYRWRTKSLKDLIGMAIKTADFIDAERAAFARGVR